MKFDAAKTRFERSIENIQRLKQSGAVGSSNCLDDRYNAFKVALTTINQIQEIQQISDKFANSEQGIDDMAECSAQLIATMNKYKELYDE